MALLFAGRRIDTGSLNRSGKEFVSCTAPSANSNGELTGDATSARHGLNVLPVPEPAYVGGNGPVYVVLRRVSQLFACERGVRGRTKQ